MISCDICEMAEFLEWRTASSLLGVRNIGLREQEMVQPQSPCDETCTVSAAVLDARPATCPHAKMSLSKTWEIRVRSVNLYQCQNPDCDIVLEFGRMSPLGEIRQR